MATTEQKSVTAETLISATVKYNNNDDASRSHDVSADVTIQGTTVQTIQNGFVRAKGSDGMTSLATFNTWSENNLSVSFETSAESNISVLTSINRFVADVKDAVKEKTINA